MNPRRLPAHLLVALLAVAVYARTLGFGFVFDDRFLVVDNAFLREPWSPLRAFAHHFWHGSPIGASYYRPLVSALSALNGRLLGWGPAGFHLVNVFLHAVNAVLVLVLARRLGIAAYGAVLAAALFAVHPAASWAVASVVARVDLLPALFVLIAWAAWAGRAKGGGRGLGAGFLFLLALLSKESAIAFLIVPLMGLRLMGAPAHREGLERDEAGRRAPWTPLLACGLALGAYVAARAGAGVGLNLTVISPLINPLGVLPFPERLCAALLLSARYLLYLLFPIRFADPRDYAGLAALPSAGDPGVILSALFLSGWALAAAILWMRRDRASLPLAFALASFLPASNLIVPIGSVYALNFLYLPLVGVSLVVGDLAGHALEAHGDTEAAGRPGRALALAAVPLLVLLAAGAMSEAAIWRDEVSLFRSWTERFPNYPLAQSRLGVALLHRRDLPAAEAELREALRMNDRNPEARFNLGVALMLRTRGKEAQYEFTPARPMSPQEAALLEEALRHTLAAASLQSDLVEARVNAGKLLLLLDRPGEAEAQARAALRLAPGSLTARLNLAEALFRLSRFDEAAPFFEEIARRGMSDRYAQARLFECFLSTGRYAEAAGVARSARQVFPDEAWFDVCLARALARSGRKTEALALLENALAGGPAVAEWIAGAEELKPYRSDPAFRRLLGERR